MLLDESAPIGVPLDAVAKDVWRTMLQHFPELSARPLDLTGTVEATTAGREDLHPMSAAQRVGDVYNSYRNYYVFVVSPRGGSRYPPRRPQGVPWKRSSARSEQAMREEREARARRQAKSIKFDNLEPSVFTYDDIDEEGTPSTPDGRRN
jgi:hypothetical protein